MYVKNVSKEKSVKLEQYKHFFGKGRETGLEFTVPNML